MRAFIRQSHFENLAVAARCASLPKFPTPCDCNDLAPTDLSGIGSREARPFLAGLRSSTLPLYGPPHSCHVNRRTSRSDRIGIRRYVSRSGNANPLRAGLSDRLDSRCRRCRGPSPSAKRGYPFAIYLPRWTTKAFPFRAGVPEASSYALGDEASLQFSDGSEYREDHFPGWGASVIFTIIFFSALTNTSSNSTNHELPPSAKAHTNSKDRRSRDSRSRKCALLRINRGVLCADSLEDRTVFFAAKGFDRISAETIYVVHVSKFVP